MAKKKVADEEVEVVEMVVEIVEDKVVKEPKVTKADAAKAEAEAVDFTEEAMFGDGPYPVVSRAAAILLGFSRYYTGVACQKGHFAPRKTKSAVCVVCARLRIRERHKARMQNDTDYRAAQYAKAKARRIANKKPAAEKVEA